MIPEILGTTDIAKLLKVRPNTVRQWRVRGILPEADITLTRGQLWYQVNIVNWAMQTKRWPQSYLIPETSYQPWLVERIEQEVKDQLSSSNGTENESLDQGQVGQSEAGPETEADAAEKGPDLLASSDARMDQDQASDGQSRYLGLPSPLAPRRPRLSNPIGPTKPYRLGP